MDWLSRELINQHLDLRHERQLLETLIWSMPGGVAFADENKIYQIVNPVFAGYSGRTPEDFIGHPLNTVVPKAIADFKTATDIVYNEGRPATVRRMPLEHEGHGRIYVDGTASPIKDEPGKLVGMLWHCFDVTDSVLLEQERNRIAVIVDNSFDAIVSISAEGIIATWNKGAERTYGYTAAEVIGQPLDVLVPSDMQLEYVGILDRVKNGKHLPFYTTERICKSGRRITVGVTVSPIRDESGEVTGASAIYRDLSENASLSN
ncbi:MAG TPA: PAS domain S-box protein [Candidatus Saccharimonadia bacterium]|jgi:PAS domain S-box-containing protein